MSQPTAAELRVLAQKFRATNRPAGLNIAVLERHRSLMVELHLEGYARVQIFNFLKETGVIRCSQPTFYRWLSANLDLQAEGIQALGRAEQAKQLAADAVHEAQEGEGGGASPAPAPAVAAAPESEPVDQLGGDVSVTPTLTTTSTTTKRTTVESGQAIDAMPLEPAAEPPHRVAARASMAMLQAKDVGAQAERAFARPDRDTRGRDG